MYDTYLDVGILVESTEGPVWLYGTSSEHAVLYQYMIYGANNVVMSMVRSLHLRFLCLLFTYFLFMDGICGHMANHGYRFKQKVHITFRILKPPSPSQALPDLPVTRNSKIAMLPNLIVQQLGASPLSALPMSASTEPGCITGSSDTFSHASIRKTVSSE